MKLNIIYILLIFISLSFTSVAQVKINYPNIDKKTYEQYLHKDWKTLIKTGKQSLKHNIDFYYLQVRMGIAYYELKKYAKAVKYFEKAHSTNNEDELIQEYLYFSYLFIGRHEDARVLAGKFKRRLKEKLKISAEHPFINAIYFDTKHDINEEYKYSPEVGEIVNQRAVLNQSYYNISLQHLIGDKVTIFHGYSNVKITNLILNDELGLPPIFDENISQNEYYFSLKAQVAKGTNLSGGFHFLHTNYYAPDPFGRIGRSGGSSSDPLYKYSKMSFAGSLNLSKQFSIMKITTGLSVSNLNYSLQLQPEVSFKIYPFNNSKFYAESKAIYLIERSEDNKSENPVFRQSFGISFLKYSWFEPSVTYGNMNNFTSHNAFIVNNDIDIIKQKYETLVNFGLSKGKFNLFFKYQYNIKENSFEIDGIENQKEYINQSITGGIMWYFRKY